MKATKQPIQKFNFKSSHRLFFDTNVWINIYVPIGHYQQKWQKQQQKKINIYTDAFKKILQRKCTIYTNALVISEFVNAYSRIRHQKEAPTTDYKQFRKKANVAADIAADTKLVLRHCKTVGTGFTQVDLNLIVDDYAKGDKDFNDQMIAELCKSKNLELVTHDSDFADYEDITIITNNGKLINS